MKIGYLQFKPEFGKGKDNIAKIENMVSDVDFDLLVIPELANSGYVFCSKEEVEEYSEKPSEGIFCNALFKISAEKKCFIVSGFCERAVETSPETGDGNINFYNSSILVCPDHNFFIYRKIHLFEEEKLFFSPGNLKFKVNRISSPNFGSVNIGMMICFDWIIPEAARTLALQGAQIICHPSNLVMPYCQQAMYTRAVENHVFIITTNRIGTETNRNKEVKFTGKSVILDTKGNYLATGSEDKEEIRIVEINPEEAFNKNINKNNHLFNDRRPEFYFS
jgi:predicted amidohydrolase